MTTRRRSLNQNLSAARQTKQDEFYTQLSDIEKELRHYTAHFKGKTVFCNCDDPRVSNFFRYFLNNFEKLRLKRLIATCYKNQQPDLFSTHKGEKGIYLDYRGEQRGARLPDPSRVKPTELKGDGDFRSDECIALLEQADIVVTNPPFSLFREYVSQLMEFDKKFIIIGPTGAVTYKEVFPLFQQNRMWLGNGFQSGNAYFATAGPAKYAKGVYDPVTGLVKFRNVSWFTNLDIAKRHNTLTLFRSYSPAAYPTYDNYEAIHIEKASEIPCDYDGIMGAPITFLDRYNPDQFEIVGITKTWFGAASKTYPTQTQVDANGTRSTVGKLNDGAVLRVKIAPKGKTYYEVKGGRYVQVYPRILIRRRASS